MALEELLASLETEAAEETARLESATQLEADRIVEEARAEARALRGRTPRDGEGEALEEAGRRRAGARLEAAAALREAHEEAFQAFLEDVRAHLAGVRERPGYPAVLAALAREGLAALPAASSLRVDPRDEAPARELLGELGASLELEVTLETAGGVELVSGDGRTARNTLEERLENAEPALRVLFGELLADGEADAEPADGA
jgi:V/A-type H+-transporting ATPase subunit E